MSLLNLLSGPALPRLRAVKRNKADTRLFSDACQAQHGVFDSEFRMGAKSGRRDPVAQCSQHRTCV
jgi:hypothetical protein